VISFRQLQVYPMDRTFGIHWIGGWMGPRVLVDDM
jgi:hypothetical protein